MMNQHDYVKECLAFYEEGGWSPEKGWEEAHYPAPENQGYETIWMLHDHHQVQGLWQSKEYGQCCFFNGDARRFLTHGPFVSGWFELWDIYDKYSTLQSSAAGKKAAELGIGIHGRSAEQMTEDGSKGGTKAAELGVGAHAPGVRSRGGKKGGTKTAELGVGVHGRSAEQMTEDGRKGGKNQPREVKVQNGKTTNSQKWVCLVTGHISSPGSLSRWQKARGIPTYLRIKVVPQVLKGQTGKG